MTTNYMHNLEQQQIEPRIENIETEDEQFIKEFAVFKEDATKNAQSILDEGKKLPVHIKEFLLVEPRLLSDLDKEAFRKFQEFIRLKDKISSKEELEEFIDYFKGYHLKCEKEARKAVAVKEMRRRQESAEEIKKKIEEIDAQEDILENSKFFVDYIVNRVEGENALLIDKLNL